MIADQGGWVATVDEQWFHRDAEKVELNEVDPTSETHEHEQSVPAVRDMGGEEQGDDEFDDLWDVVNARPPQDLAVAVKHQELPPFVQYREAVALASSLLRCSELVMDIALKRDVLKSVLASWADTCALLSNAEFIQRGIKVIVELCEGDETVGKYFNEDLTDFAKTMLPVLMTYGEMVERLGTVKLGELLRQVMDDDTFTARPGPALMGAILTQHLEVRGWAGDLLLLAKRHGHLRVVHDAVSTIARFRYFAPRALPAGEQNELEETLSELYMARRISGNRISDKRMRAALLENIRRQRLRRQMEGVILRQRTSPLELEGDGLGDEDETDD
jgi:hypothetical protein